MIWIILIAVYLVSCLISWYYIHLVYSEHGVWPNIYPDIGDLFMVFCPLFNTVFAIIIWFIQWPIRSKVHKYKIDRYNKFFKIKR